MAREIMWAPWRMSYVARDTDERQGCVFCELPGQRDDEATYILHRAHRAYVVMNRYPYNNGHLMVVPDVHVPALTDLPGEVAGELMDLTRRCQEVIQSAMGPHGFNVGINQGRAAGAGIDEHLHVHVLPRWVGDTNFMPALADTRVLPQHLGETYSLLKAGFSA